MPSTSRPISKVEAPSESRTLGMRPSQVAMARPDSVKATKTAMIHVRVVGADRVDVVVMRSFPVSCWSWRSPFGGFLVGCPPPAVRSNRFDRLV